MPPEMALSISAKVFIMMKSIPNIRRSSCFTPGAAYNMAHCRALVLLAPGKISKTSDD